ncbi:MAG: hypothetical protein NC489_14505 [Ruminococcus flavefaciens]|nr:hypothetical protein [Ruminococcus flavefaciens]
MENKTTQTQDFISTEQAQQHKCQIIELAVVGGNICDKNLIKKTHCNKIAGKSSEVYAFRTKEEISAMINVLNKHIENATNDNQRQIAVQNKMLFLIGINVGIRASDLHDLQWNIFMI